MRLLLVAATEPELAPLVARLTPASHSLCSERLRAFTHGSHQVDVLTTGVGMVATAAWCGRVLARQPYDFAVNLGVCGSFDPAFPPGTVVNVLVDCIAELGAEDGEEFLTVQQLGLLAPDEFPFRGGILVNPEAKSNRVIARLPGATGITVNTVHGNELSIARVVERFHHPVVETMEGAAFMYSCLVSGVRFAQVRAVSNMVEKRNRAAWKMGEAVTALADAGLRLIEHG
jgi:futalosine hydrolase